MSLRKSQAWWALVVGLGAVGCGNEVHAVPSHEINTRRVRAEISVVAESADTATVVAWLFRNNDTLDLSDEDTLVARHGVFSVEMARVHQELPATWAGFKFGDEVHYAAVFDGAEAESTFEVSFFRASDGNGGSGESAPFSVVSLPGPFEVTAPEEDATIQADEKLLVEWSEAEENDEMEIAVRGDCIDEQTLAAVSGKGKVTLPGSIFQRTDGDDDTCHITLTVSRVREGDLDEHFGDGGFIDARQIRTVHLKLKGA